MVPEPYRQRKGTIDLPQDVMNYERDNDDANRSKLHVLQSYSTDFPHFFSPNSSPVSEPPAASTTRSINRQDILPHSADRLISSSPRLQQRRVAYLRDPSALTALPNVPEYD